MVFKPNSLVVVAGRRGWWPTQSNRWRRALEDEGHFVAFIDTSKPKVLGARPVSIGARQSSSATTKQGEISMLDVFYLAIGLVGFVALWGITKFCDRVWED